METNLSKLEQEINESINPNASFGEILAFNHNKTLKNVLASTGKYIGFNYVSVKRTEDTVLPGEFVWINNAINTATAFIVKVSKRSNYHEDIGFVLDNLGTKSVMQFKDFEGRSAFYEYVSHSQKQDTSGNFYYDLIIKAIESNSNYAYQDLDEFDCVLSFFKKDYYDELESLINSVNLESIKTYQTLAELQAVSSPTVNQSGIVANDTTNNGYYGYDGTNWVKNADLVENIIEETNTTKGVSGKAVYDESIKKLDKQFSSNKSNPLEFRPGYFYFTGNGTTIQYNASNNYGLTGYIPASTLGLITTGAGQSSQGLLSYVVFDENKSYIRKGENSNQYTYQAGDFFVVFSYLIQQDLLFAEKVGVIEGTVYEFEPYTEYMPLSLLDDRVTVLEKGLTSDKILNGNPVVYGDVSNFSNTGIIERNVEDDYLVFFRENTGNHWSITPVFVPTGSNLVHLKFNVEFTRVGGHSKGLTIYVADETSVGGNFIAIKNVVNDGDYDITFDPAYYTVYEGYVQFYVWIANQSIQNGESTEAKLTGLKVLEYTDEIQSTNIEGDNVKELFESTDLSITDIKNSINNKAGLVAPNGDKYELGVDINGNLVSIPIVPSTGAFFGNSLLSGFGSYGMAASQSDKDYYYLITEFIKTLNPTFTSTRNSSGGFENITDAGTIDSVIQAGFLDVLTGNEQLVSIQLGDNVNTPEKNAVFGESSLKLCQAIRNHCPNARVVWIGMWYGTTERYNHIQNACSQTGCSFITMADLINTSTKNSIGNLTEKGSGARVLNDVTNVVENTPTNITVTFDVGGTSYETTLDVDTYTYNINTLNYTSDFEIISSSGVASHPNDEGFRFIANRFLKEMKLTDNNEYYV